ncbi:MAG: 50S ribosomal protein L24 [Actinomycetes bacterium]|jgi:large subunit ribosomal protein L24|nr:50S ribosomal protein L24 [Actinomycetes bacterium]
MTALRIRKDDKVVVIAGKDKGKEGRVLAVHPGSRRVIVERVAVAKKTQRPTQTNPQGGFADIEQPVHVSNVMLICPKCNKPTRVSIHRDTDGKRTRVCKKCAKDID